MAVYVFIICHGHGSIYQVRQFGKGQKGDQHPDSHQVDKVDRIANARPARQTGNLSQKPAYGYRKNKPQKKPIRVTAELVRLGATFLD